LFSSRRIEEGELIAEEQAPTHIGRPSVGATIDNCVRATVKGVAGVRVVSEPNG
jgi:hypothetical protein